MRLKLACRHRWDLSPRRAIALQERLRRQVREQALPARPRTCAGIDVGFEAGGRVTRAAVVVLDAGTLAPVDQALVRRPTRFPYVPGLLSFREIPAVLAALRKLRGMPDVLLCDGQGIAHPRRIGIAAHLGVLLDVPTIGVGKTRLVGTHADCPGERGAWVPLCDGDEIIGAVVRTRAGVAPLFVSRGHRMTLADAIATVLGCCTRYRLPETTRLAHRLASGPCR